MRSSVTGDHTDPFHVSKSSSPIQSHHSARYEVRGSNYVSPSQRPVDGRFQAQAGTRSPISSSTASAPMHYRSPQSQSRLGSDVARSYAPNEGWFALLLLSIAVYSVVFSIISINQVEHSYILLMSTAIGLLVGLLVAKLRYLPPVILHLGACLLGHWLSVFFVSALAFHVSWIELLGDLRAVIAGEITSSSSSGDMIFLFYLCFLSFFLGYFGAWLIYRAHLPWLVALVYCSILLINLGYAKQDQSLFVIVLVTTLLLLIARIQLAKQLANWTSEGLHTDRQWLQNITARFMRISAVLAVVTLLASLILPALGQPASGFGVWEGLNNLWANITRGHLSFQNGNQFSQPAANFFGDSLSITGNVNLPNGEVLYYTSSATQPQYLEGFTFDHFDGHTWTSSAPSPGQNYPAGAPIPPNLQGNANQATTIVTVEQPPEGSKHYIFAPYEPTSFSVNTTLYGKVFTNAWTQSDSLTTGEHYQVTSLIPNATAENLSGVPLPANDPSTWSNDSNYSVLQEYLQIPKDLASTVLNVAQQWTKGASNAYQAVEMLQNHLNDSTQFTYSVTNPPVPANIDAVTWLLQTHQGYCTYYATAMTVMARLLGIPARVVSGFSSGQFDAQRKVWGVKGSDAHSWVQVYFPGYGWISFDPTPGYAVNGVAQPQPAPTPIATQPGRPTPTPAAGSTKPSHPSTPGSTSGTSGTALNAKARWSFLLELSLALLFCLVLAFAIVIFRYRQRDYSTQNSLVSRMYWRVCRLAGWAGLAPQGWQTPYEYSRALVRHFPQVTAPVRRLTDLYVRERWAAPHEMPHSIEQADLERLWPHLRKTFLRSLFVRFRRGKIKAS